MNYREKIRKAIECPQFGNEAYGEWGALNLEQRKYIKRLLDELDRADNYFKRLYFENKQLKEEYNKIQKAYESTFSDYQQLKDNWNELRKWIVYNKHNENTEQHYLVVDYGTLLGKMIKLEQGSDSNE